LFCLSNPISLNRAERSCATLTIELHLLIPHLDTIYSHSNASTFAVQGLNEHRPLGTGNARLAWEMPRFEHSTPGGSDFGPVDLEGVPRTLKQAGILYFAV
jgi:hypothetical protein